MNNELIQNHFSKANFTYTGFSMSPTFLHDDILTIDHNQQNIINGQIYVIKHAVAQLSK